MQPNTVQSLELGSAIYERFGSWEAARQAVRQKGWSYVVGDDEPVTGRPRDDAADASIVPRQSGER